MTVKEFPPPSFLEVNQQYLSGRKILRYELVNLVDPFLLKNIKEKA